MSGHQVTIREGDDIFVVHCEICGYVHNDAGTSFLESREEAEAVKQKHDAKVAPVSTWQRVLRFVLIWAGYVFVVFPMYVFIAAVAFDVARVVMLGMLVPPWMNHVVAPPPLIPTAANCVASAVNAYQGGTPFVCRFFG